MAKRITSNVPETNDEVDAKLDKANAKRTANAKLKAGTKVKAAKLAAVDGAVKQAWAVPLVFVDSEAHTFIQVGTQLPEQVPAYLTSRLGYVTIEYHGTGFPDLKPLKYTKPFAEAVKPYTPAGGNELDVSSLARDVIIRIVSNTDPDCTDFLSPIVAANKAANKPTPSRAKPAGKASSKPGKKPAMTGDFVTLAQLLEEFKLDGKKVRGKLRAHYTKPAEGWVWMAKEADAIRTEMKKWFSIK